MIREGHFLSDILWVVKFYEGGVSYSTLMDMPLPELNKFLIESNKIVQAYNNG